MTQPCVDQDVGRLLPEYELGLLGQNDLATFEQHLMACEHCFGQVEAFAPAARRLRTEPFRAIVRSAQPGQASESWVTRLLGWLWPTEGPWLKPAVALVSILILAPLAWQGLRQSDQPTAITPAKEISLVRTRSTGTAATIIVPPATDLVVEFGFEPELPEQPIRVRLIAPDQSDAFQSATFELDARQTGRLTIPAPTVLTGEYLLVLEDPHATGPLAVDTLRFTVRRP